VSVDAEERAEFRRQRDGHHARNFLLNVVGEGTGFRIGINFIAELTVLSVFVSGLTEQKWVIGLVPGLFVSFWCFPQLVVAYYSDALKRKRKLILWMRFLGALPFLVLGALLALRLIERPAVILSVFFVCMVLCAAFTGAVMPPWVAMVGKLIRKDIRGRFYGWRAITGTLAGFFVGWAINRILGPEAGPDRFGVLFMCSAGGFLISFLCLLATREPADLRAAEREGFRRYFIQLPQILKSDRIYRWFLVTTLCMSLGGGAVGMAGPFYAISAIERFGAPLRIVGGLTAIMALAQLLGAVVGGRLCDRKGPFLTYTLGVACTLVAPFCALAATSTRAVYIALGFVGLSLGATMSSYHNVFLTLAPPEKRATYLALTNFIRSPVFLLSPFLGGVLLGHTNYTTLFACAAVGSAAAGVLAVIVTVKARALGLGGPSSPSPDREQQETRAPEKDIEETG